MARKRKKSRSNKKQRKEQRPSEAQATDAPQAVEPAGDEQPTESTPIDPVSEDVAALDDEEPEVISLDDEEPEITEFSIDDDEEDRERLIAETLALVAAEEAGTDPAAVEEAGGEESAPADADREEDADAPGPAEDTAAASDSLSITYDAVAALTEMQAEGLIDLPDDLVIDLGEATTDEQRDRLLAAALSHVEMQEARYRVPIDTRRGRRWKGTAASALVTLALLVAVAPPGILIPEPPAQLTESDRSYGVLVALLVQAQQIDAFRVREQRLPEDLGEVGTVLHDIRFVKSSNRLYQLVAYTTDGIAVVYDSAAPATIFERVAESWITTREDM